jgi:hypothetical protein
VSTTRFWNNLHQVRSKSKGWKVKRQRRNKENGDRNNKSIIKIKVLLPRVLVTLADFGDPILGPLVYLLAKLFKLFGFPTFRF